MSKLPGHSGDRLHSYALRAALLVVVVLVLFVLRPTGSPGPSGSEEDVAPADVQTTSGTPADGQPSDPPRTATDEEFCAEFVRMAESQGQFVSGGAGGAAQLEDAADALVGVGVPANMSLPARDGYFTLIGGVYDSIGLELAREAVGAPPTAVDRGDAAFSAYLAQYCPA